MAEYRASLRKLAVRSSLWSVTGTGAQGGIQLVVLVVLARLVTPEEFGIIGAALVVLGILEIVTQIGLPQAIVQRQDLTRDHVTTATVLLLAITLAAAFLIALLAPAISNFFGVPSLQRLVPVLVAILPLRAFSTIRLAELQRELRFKRLAVIEVISYTVGYAGVAIPLAYAGLGVWALAGAIIGEASLKTLVLLIGSKRPAGKIDRKALVQLLGFGAGLSLAQVGHTVASQGDNLIVGRQLGPDALGMYGRAYQLMMAPVTVLGTVLNKVLFPVLAKVQGSPATFGRALAVVISTVSVAALPASVLVVVLAPEIIEVLMGPAWSGVIAPFQVLAAFTYFRLANRLTDAAARASGAVYRNAWRQWLYALSVLLGAWVGSGWGPVGVAVGTAAALCIKFLLSMHLVLKLAGMSLARVFRLHVPGLVAAAATAVLITPAAMELREATLPIWGRTVAAAVVGMAVLTAAVAGLVELGGVVGANPISRWSTLGVFNSGVDHERMEVK